MRNAENILYAVERRPFTIGFRRSVPEWGAFWFVRLFGTLRPEGGHWFLHSVFYTAQILALFPLLALDIAVLAALLLGWIVKLVFRALWQIFYSIVQAVLFPTLRTALILAVIIAILIVVFYRFETIREKLLQLFDYVAQTI